MTEENTERVERQKKTPITVIIGNPPYNVGQLNENDNNKNRKYRGHRQPHQADLRQGLQSDAQTRKLYDPYVKFFRWATDRLQDRDGIVCFVSPTTVSSIKSPSTGCESICMQDFTRIYHSILHGNVRKIRN